MRAVTYLTVILLTLTGAAAAGEPPVDPEARIVKLIQGLGADEWRTRENATDALRAIGEPALAGLKEATRSTDAEVRARAGQLVREIERELVLARMGLTLIADTYGGRVIEIDAKGTVRWSITGLNQPVSVQRLSGGRTLVAERAGGRVTVYGRDKKVLWRMADLGHVWCAVRLPNGNTLITSCGAELFSQGKVIEVDKDKKVVWETAELAAPRSCQRLANGHTLIVERANNRVIEMDKDKKIVWKKEGLNAPLGATRLANGNTLISEWSPPRILEVNAKGEPVWRFGRDLGGTGDAQRLPGGHTLITDFVKNRIIQVDAKGNLIWEYAGLHSPCAAVRLEKKKAPREKGAGSEEKKDSAPEKK